MALNAMTWAELRNAVNAMVEDDEEVWYIDVSFPDGVRVFRDEACGVAVVNHDGGERVSVE